MASFIFKTFPAQPQPNLPQRTDSLNLRERKPCFQQAGPHRTRTEMFLDRKAEKKSFSNSLKESWDLTHPTWVPPTFDPKKPFEGHA